MSKSRSIQDIIENKLATEFKPLHLQVLNESSNHNVPAGSESHFKVILVSDDFEGDRLLQRHRRINKILADELEHHIHALALHTYTAKEWKDKHGDAPMSPQCQGGDGQVGSAPEQ